MSQPHNFFTRILLDNSHLVDTNSFDLAMTTSLRQHFDSQTVLQFSALPIDKYLASYWNFSSEELVCQGWNDGLSISTWTSETYAQGQGDVLTTVKSGYCRVNWRETEFLVFRASRPLHVLERSKEEYYALIFSGDTKIGREFISELGEFDNQVKAKGKVGVWVLEGGIWKRDLKLLKDVDSTVGDDPVLKDNVAECIKNDVYNFFENEALYKGLSVSWKRGLLLVGPPGNGKSHMIKAIVKELPHPCIYVTSMRPSPSHDGDSRVRNIFGQARKLAPCLLVIEDLDGVLAPETQSFFLNELDGFSQNHGILIIASTNHPDKIDDAIMKRPSRFDVRYDFPMPDAALRQEFILKWFKKINTLDALRKPRFPDEAALAKQMVQATDGFSFSHLQELFISLLLSFAHIPSGGELPDGTTSLFHQAEILRRQILAGQEAEGNPSDQEGRVKTEVGTATEMQKSQSSKKGGTWSRRMKTRVWRAYRCIIVVSFLYDE